MHRLCLELAAYLLMSEVCSQFSKTANLKSIVLLDHIFIDKIAIPMALKITM